ncbi:MAG: phytanoyl-CoA dioxygenase family protein [Bacteroidota bacterium]
MIDAKQLNRFHENGYLLLESYLPNDIMEQLVNDLPVLFSQDSEAVYRQDGSDAIRTVFSPEQFSPIYDRVSRLDLIVEPIRQLLEDEVYLFQSKFNTKVSLARGCWDWHQDFTFWKDDGMPAPKAITVAIYLQDVTDFSGPMVVIPGSHKLGTVHTTMENPDGVHSENLKYVISRETIQEATEQCGGMVSTAGPRGTVLFFHSNVLHASTQNLYFKNRDLLMLTYNAISNASMPVSNPRPEYMVKRNFNAIKTVASLR